MQIILLQFDAHDAHARFSPECHQKRIDWNRRMSNTQSMKFILKFLPSVDEVAER